MCLKRSAANIERLARSSVKRPLRACPHPCLSSAAVGRTRRADF